MSFFEKTGAYLNGYQYSEKGDCILRNKSTAEKIYFSDTCLTIITGVGFLLLALGIVARAVSKGSLPTLGIKLQALGITYADLSKSVIVFLSSGGTLVGFHLTIILVKNTWQTKEEQENNVSQKQPSPTNQNKKRKWENTEAWRVAIFNETLQIAKKKQL